ncbi:MAG: hypothetical protein EAZ91_13705 [Cytophagales bacterium]|nr:MAG: hypothetical protein EAZ91_13705 [Cytophagales bacterium]
MPPIEPAILPLVDALNATGLVRTFSSCEGHFDPSEQTLVDRNHAYVRFVPAEGITTEQVEAALGRWLMAYKKKHGLMPVRVVGYKLFTPVDDEIDVTFVLELHPFNRFDRPETKRADIDRAVLQLARLT